MSPKVKNYLLETARYPESWDQHEDLPEDPTLLSSGEVILETISHEGEVFVDLLEKEAEELRRKGFDLIDAEEARYD